MINCIEFKYEKKYIRDFLKLPDMLYNKRTNTQNKLEVKQILLNKHILSKYYNINKFLIYDDKKVVGRFIITTYKNDKNCYIGFFEVYNNSLYAKNIFDTVKKFAKKNGYERIIGPLDCSFWIKYRLKKNLFNKRPYTSEPYNKEYYLELFKQNKFKEYKQYISNSYRVVEKNYYNNHCYERYKKFIDKGYEIKSPNKKDYNKVINELYYLLNDLYKNFPMYKYIEREDFIKLFKNYKYILNMNMVKLAYYKEEMVGFFINFPNYNNTIYRLNSIFNILKILNIKKNPKEYIMLYMGVNQEHKGLGNVLSYKILEELKGKDIKSIGALIMEGKPTINYIKDKIEQKYEYTLLEYELNQKTDEQ